MAAQPQERVRKRLVWFSPYLLAVALMPAFIQIDYSGCFYYGDSRLSELELIVEGENRITGFDSDQRSYDVVLPWDTTEAQVRTVSNDPEGRVWVFVLIDGERFTYLDDGHGGSDIVVPLSPGSSVLQVAVAPHGRATDFYEVAIEIGIDLCAGADCDDGNDCTADICDPADGSCTNDLLPEGTLCGVDGVCDAGACRERSWGTPEMVYTDTDDGPMVTSPQVDMDPSGNAIAMWLHQDQSQGWPWELSVWANRYTPSGGWGTAEAIGTDTVATAQFPRMAMDPNGNATVVWHVVWPADDKRPERIWANRYTPGEGWGISEAIETDPGVYAACAWPQVAVDSDGNAIAMWTNQQVPRILWANRYTPSGGWGTAQMIETDDTVDASSPILAMDPAGNAVVMFFDGRSPTRQPWSIHYTPSGGWEAPVPLNGFVGVPWNVVMGANGNAIAIWEATDLPYTVSLWANSYTPSSGWGPLELIETHDAGSSLDAEMAIDSNGNVIAVWQQNIGVAYSVTDNDVASNRYTPSEGWGTAQRIDDTQSDNRATAPQVAMDANGNAIAVWQAIDAQNIMSIWANRYWPNRGWGVPEVVSGDGSAATPVLNPRVSMSPNGNAVIVWMQGVDGSGTASSLWSNRFE